MSLLETQKEQEPLTLLELQDFEDLLDRLMSGAYGLSNMQWKTACEAIQEVRNLIRICRKWEEDLAESIRSDEFERAVERGDYDDLD